MSRGGTQRWIGLPHKLSTRWGVEQTGESSCHGFAVWERLGGTGGLDALAARHLTNKCSPIQSLSDQDCYLILDGITLNVKGVAGGLTLPQSRRRVDN